MLPFPDITGLEVFPGMESNTLEFKLSLSNSIKNKTIPTICAFLNGKGGYIVFGVEDKDRRIVGLGCSMEELNHELLWFDNFYHCKRITDHLGDPLDPGTLSARIIEVNEDVRVLVLTIRPVIGKSYRCQDGSEWHRLAASIYKIKEVSHEKEIVVLKERLSAERRKCEMAVSELSVLKDDMRSLIGEAKKMEKQLDLFSDFVAKDIILKKESIEKRSVLCDLFSFLPILVCSFNSFYRRV